MNIPYRDVVGIAAGFSQVFLLRSNGSLVSWQEGKAATPVSLPKLKAIASSGDDELIGLTDDGRYIKWTQSFSQTLDGAALTSIASVDVPGYYSDLNTNLGITNNGELIRLDPVSPNSPKFIVLWRNLSVSHCLSCSTI